MIEVGDEAPPFALPGVQSGAIREYALTDAGTDVVVLAFYPADFLSDHVEALRDFDILALRRGVTVYGISPDTAYSHRAFAEEYGIDVPLLADVTTEVAADFGVESTDAYDHPGLPRFSVVVVDHDRVVRYVWTAETPSRQPNVATIQDAISAIGDDPTAVERYRTGFDNCEYGTEEFDIAADAFEEGQWRLSAEAFGETEWYFDRAAEEFAAARRFAEDGDVESAAERAEEYASHMSQAARWYRDAAERYAHGTDRLGDESCADAQSQRDAATNVEPLVHPDDLADPT